MKHGRLVFLRRLLFGSLASLLTSTLGCGFEHRVEGRWQPEPGTVEAKALERHGAPSAMSERLVTGEFIANDGVVYLGVEHEDAALLRYHVVREHDDCATVRLEGVAGTQSLTTEVEACLLSSEALSLRHDGGENPLDVTFRRVDGAFR